MGAKVSPRKEYGGLDRTLDSFNRQTQSSGPMSKDDAMKKVFEYAPPSVR